VGCIILCGDAVIRTRIWLVRTTYMHIWEYAYVGVHINLISTMHLFILLGWAEIDLL